MKTESRGRSAVVLALLDLFSEDKVPEDFAYEGQTWGERAEAWVMHAAEQLEGELEDFTTLGSDPCGEKNEEAAC